jgi:hypothetical protein
MLLFKLMEIWTMTIVIVVEAQVPFWHISGEKKLREDLYGRTWLTKRLANCL